MDQLQDFWLQRCRDHQTTTLKEQPIADAALTSVVPVLRDVVGKLVPLRPAVVAKVLQCYGLAVRCLVPTDIFGADWRTLLDGMDDTLHVEFQEARLYGRCQWALDSVSAVANSFPGTQKILYWYLMNMILSRWILGSKTSTSIFLPVRLSKAGGLSPR